MFAELVLYIEEVCQHNVERAPVFKVSDLARLYTARMEQLGIKLDMRPHTTRLKQRLVAVMILALRLVAVMIQTLSGSPLLAEFTDMRAQKKGRDILLAFENDIGPALAKACEIDSDSDAIILARAAKIVRNHMFEDAKPFTGLTEGCQKESVSSLLLALILEGPTITDHDERTTLATLSIAQLIKFNSIKHRRKEPSTEAISVRHNSAQETPLPIYVGLMLHGHARKKVLVDRLYHLGLSVSYDHVLRLSAHNYGKSSL